MLQNAIELQDGDTERDAVERAFEDARSTASHSPFPIDTSYRTNEGGAVTCVFLRDSIGTTAIPAQLMRLRELKVLNVSYCALRSLPNNIDRLQTLTTLIVSNNVLAELPDAIGRLPRLQTLIMYRNRLAALPACVGDLHELEHLDVALNQLVSLPTTFAQLTRLRRLYLHHNRLTALPDTTALERLDRLELSHNRITELPDSDRAIRQLHALLEIRLHGNPLRDMEAATRALPPGAL